MSDQTPDSTANGQKIKSGTQPDPNSDQTDVRNQQAAGNSVTGSGEQLTEEQRKIVQSVADKAIAQRLNTAARKAPSPDFNVDAYEAYRAEGMTPQQAQKSMKIDAMLASSEQQPTTATGQIAGDATLADAPKPEKLDIVSALVTMGLNPSKMTREESDKLSNFLVDESGQQKFLTQVDLTNALVIAVANKDFSAQPNNAQPSGSGSAGHIRPAMATPPLPPVTNLQAEYDKEKVNYQGDVDGLFDLKMKYKKLGLEIS